MEILLSLQDTPNYSAAGSQVHLASAAYGGGMYPPADPAYSGGGHMPYPMADQGNLPYPPQPNQNQPYPPQPNSNQP